MAHDKITVDEPLISTDVDSLIRMIAERKRIPLNELRSMCKIDKKTLDKWIAVLEDEGYISIEYGLRGTNVLWRDVPGAASEEKNYRMVGPRSQVPNEPPFEPAPQRPRAPESSEEFSVDSEKDDEPQSAAAQDAAEAKKDEVNSEFTVETPLEEEPEPEELLSEYLARKRTSGSEDVEDIKSIILTSLKGDSKKEEPKEASDGPEEPDEPENDTKDDSLSELVKSVEDDSARESAQEDEAEAEEEPEDAPIKPSYSKETLRPEKERAVDVRELMGSYMDEINKEKTKIETLKKERESLYREKFATMEGKMQADIVVLTEKIIEKESKI
ncbi:MAG: hypothetical protein V1861_02465, partial [Candidatus Micrarchaeota archaeon]